MPETLRKARKSQKARKRLGSCGRGPRTAQRSQKWFGRGPENVQTRSTKDPEMHGSGRGPTTHRNSLAKGQEHGGPKTESLRVVGGAQPLWSRGLGVQPPGLEGWGVQRSKRLRAISCLRGPAGRLQLGDTIKAAGQQALQPSRACKVWQRPHTYRRRAVVGGFGV